MSVKNSLNNYEKNWYKQNNAYFITKLFVFFILCALSAAFGLSAIGPLLQDKRSVTLLFISFVTAIPAAYFFIKLRRRTAFKTPYAHRLIYASFSTGKIAYSFFYNSNSDSTIITLLSGADLAQTSLPGQCSEENVRKFLENELLKHHGDLTKFPVYKDLFKNPL